jgi:hypothetical protein
MTQHPRAALLFILLASDRTLFLSLSGRGQNRTMSSVARWLESVPCLVDVGGMAWRMRPGWISQSW